MSGVEDLKAAMPVIQKETSQSKMHMYGTSSGGIRAAAFAQAKPEHVDRLILSAFTYKGTAPRRSRGGGLASTSCAPTREGSATLR